MSVRRLWMFAITRDARTKGLARSCWCDWCSGRDRAGRGARWSNWSDRSDWQLSRDYTIYKCDLPFGWRGVCVSRGHCSDSLWSIGCQQYTGRHPICIVFWHDGWTRQHGYK